MLGAHPLFLGMCGFLRSRRVDIPAAVLSRHLVQLELRGGPVYRSRLSGHRHHPGALLPLTRQEERAVLALLHQPEQPRQPQPPDLLLDRRVGATGGCAHPHHCVVRFLIHHQHHHQQQQASHQLAHRGASMADKDGKGGGGGGGFCVPCQSVYSYSHIPSRRLGFMALPVSTLMIWCVPRVRWSIPLVCLGATLLFVCLFLVKVLLSIGLVAFAARRRQWCHPEGLANYSAL
mmetsp:Transcript_30167/g.87634  ORF Transcript_30167/g.87634 Transcript_30167/m.87634 type:complete len:233 (+) Transcript_30167:1517-2215(+)